jgi:hypothetical protein
MYAWGLLQVDARPVVTGQDGAEGTVRGIRETLPQALNFSKRVVGFKEVAERLGDSSSEGQSHHACCPHYCQYMPVCVCICLYVPPSIYIVTYHNRHGVPHMMQSDVK